MASQVLRALVIAAALLALPGSAYAQLSTGLISFWSLEEASGTRNDSHGTNHLTDNNTVTSGTGKVGTAADFEASTTEYLSVADNASVSTGNIDWSIALWFNPESVGANQGLITKGWPSGEYIIYISSGNNVKLQVESGAAEVTTVGTVSVGTWYYVVAWHDSVNDLIGISLDNATAVTASYAGGITDNAAAVTIGADVTDGLWYDGLIDQVGFWKRVLSSQDRTDLYNSGNGLSYAAMLPAVTGRSFGLLGVGK